MKKTNAKKLLVKEKIESIKWDEEGINLCLTGDYVYCLFLFYNWYKHYCKQVVCVFPDSRIFASMTR